MLKLTRQNKIEKKFKKFTYKPKRIRDSNKGRKELSNDI